MDGDSNLVDDLSTQTVMTRPSFHNSGDYVTDGPCLTQRTQVADCGCLRCRPPHHAALSAVPETSEGSAAGGGVLTVRKIHVTEDRTRLTQAMEIEIAASLQVFTFSNPIPCVLLVPVGREVKDGKCESQGLFVFTEGVTKRKGLQSEGNKQVFFPVHEAETKIKTGEGTRIGRYTRAYKIELFKKVLKHTTAESE